jgi:hypothetical protein
MPSDAKLGRWLLQEPMVGDRRAVWMNASPIIGYRDVFAARFFLFTEDDAIVGTYYWLLFYNKTPIECYVKFSAVLPPVGFRADASFSGSVKVENPQRGATEGAK